MRAAGRVIGDFTLAERADALGLHRRGFSLLVNLIHRADDEEHAERRQDEVDDILDKQTIVHRADAGSRSRLNGRIALPVERNKQPRKIDAAVSTPISGMKMSLTSDVVIVPNAAPMITPTAMSMTFPRMANALKSSKNFFIGTSPFYFGMI